jgi:hypothetical protein
MDATNKRKRNNMKAHLKIVVLLLAGGIAMASTALAEDVSVSASVGIPGGVSINAVGDFDTPLAAEGTWVSVGNYGRCWHPRGVAADWRPYCEGQWVWTDGGWFWQSDDP